MDLKLVLQERKRKNYAQTPQGNLHSLLADISADVLKNLVQEAQQEIAKLFIEAKSEIKVKLVPYLQQYIEQNKEKFKGEPGDPGESVNEQRVIMALEEMLPTIDEQKILDALSVKLPKAKDIEKNILSTITKKVPTAEDVVEMVLEKTTPIYVEQLVKEWAILQKQKKSINVADIKGLDTLLSQLENKLVHQTRKKESLLRGGGDIVEAGTGITVTRSANGRRVISATVPAGGTVYYTPTGDVDASNKVFGVTAQPTSVIADGTVYFENAGYTYAGLTITMDVAPSQYAKYTL